MNWIQPSMKFLDINLDINLTFIYNFIIPSVLYTKKGSGNCFLVAHYSSCVMHIKNIVIIL